MIWRWWQDWRERRAVLRDLKELQRDEEMVLSGQNTNPLNLASLAVVSDPAEAAAQWERARRMMPDTTLKSEESLDILLGLKRYDEAEDLMRARLKRYPHDGFALTALAKIAEHRGDTEETLKRWMVVRDRVLDTTYGFHGCGRCFLALGRLDEAEAQFKAALRRGSYNLEANTCLAMISDRRKDWPASLERWTHTAETFAYAAAFAFAAKAMVELGRADEADAYLGGKAHLFPGDLEIVATQAHLAQRRGDWTAACDRWAVVRAISPDFQAGYYLGARCLFETGRHAEADAVLRAAIERFPLEMWPLRDFASLAHERGDWNQAVDRWEALRRGFPQEELGFTLGANALQAAGRIDEAAALRKGS
jgi:tetratricopeptide (TPR) repeat protein